MNTSIILVENSDQAQPAQPTFNNQLRPVLIARGLNRDYQCLLADYGPDERVAVNSYTYSVNPYWPNRYLFRCWNRELTELFFEGIGSIPVEALGRWFKLGMHRTLDIRCTSARVHNNFDDLCSCWMDIK